MPSAGIEPPPFAVSENTSTSGPDGNVVEALIEIGDAMVSIEGSGRR
jgi:hypothetical protein